VETLVLQRQPEGDLPADVAPHPIDRLAVRGALERLQQHDLGDKRWRHRVAAACPVVEVGEVPVGEQPVAEHGELAVDRVLGNQMPTKLISVQQLRLMVNSAQHPRLRGK